MVLQNSSNQVFSNNADGYSLGGGVTRRTLTLTGADFPLSLSAVATNDILQYNGTNWINVAGTTFGTGSVTSVSTGTGLTGGPVTNTGTISIAANGVSNALFRQSAAFSIVGNPTGSTANVSDITLGTGLTFTGSTLALSNSGITAGTYGDATHYTTFTVDALGRVTAVGTVALGDMAFQHSNNVTITGGTITGLSNPINPSDAATKAYVDGIATGLDAKQSVRTSTTADLDGAYSGTPNFTLTGNNNGALVVDGVTVAVNDRVLVKNQTDEKTNGIYSVTQTGDVGSPYILTRTVDMDMTSEVPAAYTFVVEGSTNSGNGYVVTGFNESDVLDTNNIVWTQFSQAGAYSTASDGGLSIDTSSTPSLFKVNFQNILNAGALGTSNLVAISQDGTNVVKTTIGSLATLIAGASVFGSGAINVTSGTVSLVTDGEFSQAGGTLSLGDITPTSITTGGTINSGDITATNVTSTGTVSGSNLTGTNTGDQTITLTGDVTGSGTGSFATTLANSGVTAGTYGLPTIVVDAKGRVTSAVAATIGSGIVFSSNTLSANVDGTTVIDTGGPIAVRFNTTGGIQATATGIALNIASLNTDGTALVAGDLSVVSHAGTTVTTTLGSLAAFFAANSVFGTNAIHASNGTVSLLTTANFTQTAGTLDLSDTGVIAGTYNTVVVDAKGRITAGTGSSLSWVDVTATTQQLAPNTGYMADNSSLVTLTLPVSANFGDIIPIVGYGSGGWTIAQNAGQIIHFGNEDSTSGTSGSLSSTNRFDSLELFCAVADTAFVVRNSVGNIEID